MSRDSRVGASRVMLRCDLSQVRGIRRSLPSTGRGPAGTSEILADEADAIGAASRAEKRTRSEGAIPERDTNPGESNGFATPP